MQANMKTEFNYADVDRDLKLETIEATTGDNSAEAKDVAKDVAELIEVSKQQTKLTDNNIQVGYPLINLSSRCKMKNLVSNMLIMGPVLLFTSLYEISVLLLSR